MANSFEHGLSSSFNQEEHPEQLRKEAEAMTKAALPLLLRFLSDRQPEVSLSVSNFVSDLLRMARRPVPRSRFNADDEQYKKLHVSKVVTPTNVSKKNMPPPPTPPLPVSTERRQFLSSLLDISVRQLAWREDAIWEAPTGEEPDPDDEIATFRTMRTVSKHLFRLAGLTRPRCAVHTLSL